MEVEGGGIDWGEVERAVESGRRRRSREEKVLPGGGRVTRPGRGADGEDWSRWKAGAWGTAPRWEWRSGPQKAVERVVGELGAGLEVRRIAGHVETVWGTLWQQMARRMFVDPMAFGQRLAAHVSSCPVCTTDAGIRIWAVCLPKLGLNDVIKVLRRGDR